MSSLLYVTSLPTTAHLPRSLNPLLRTLTLLSLQQHLFLHHRHLLLPGFGASQRQRQRKQRARNQPSHRPHRSCPGAPGQSAPKSSEAAVASCVKAMPSYPRPALHPPPSLASQLPMTSNDRRQTTSRS
ncbi:hypothetical protein ACFX12_046193 [Malus domestica]